MVDELKRRTSNFFPVADISDNGLVTPLGPALSPNLDLYSPLLGHVSQLGQLLQNGQQLQSGQLPNGQLQNGLARDYYMDEPPAVNNRNSSLFSTPSFLSPEQSFSLNLLGVSGLSLSGLISPYATRLGESSGPSSVRISYSAPNILNDTSLGRKLDFSLSQQLHNLGLDEPSHLKDPFSDKYRFSLRLESPKVGHRLSIWSTTHREETPLLRESGNGRSRPFSESLTPPEMFEEKKKNSSRHKTSKFLSESPASTRRTNSADHSVDPLLVVKKPVDAGQRHNKSKNGIKAKEKDPSNLPKVVVKFSNVDREYLDFQPEEGESLGKLCSKHVLNNLGTKIYPEDYCSTFYKRNKHGYMFIREPSSSLKVNSSGPKSWVTIKLKLGNQDTQKLKVDVRKLPEWKPINLNLNFVPRKHGRRDHRNKLIDGSHRSRKAQPRG